MGLALPLLAACQLEQEFNPSVEAGELPTSVVQFVDLPVPQRLKILSGVQQSWSYQSGRFRNAKLHYVGSVAFENVRAFLRERLPTHGWRLIDEERPTEERIVQRWLSETEPGVQCLLDAELRAEGPKSRLHYHLWTRGRSGSRPIEASTPKK